MAADAASPFKGGVLVTRLVWNLLCNPGWPQTHMDPSASGFHVPPQLALLTFQKNIIYIKFEVIRQW